MVKSRKYNHCNVTGNDPSISGIKYDLNGNIENLQRNLSGTLVDDLSYTYGSGNQLDKVTDGGTTDLFDNGTSGTLDDYLYDDNGNMVKDANKDITDIEYNHLNLPETVTFGNGDKVNYSYDAAGVKLRKVFSPDAGSNDTTDYVGGFHYSNSTIEFVQTVEGRYVFGTENEFQYHLKDHLGNTRATVRDDNGSVEVIGRDDYYPFGLTFNSFTRSYSTPQNYKFNQGASKTHLGEVGKFFRVERQPELGVDFTKFRVYDYAIGRFWQVDPLADAADQESLTPYHYVRNNPINYTDPYGDCDLCKGVLKGTLNYAKALATPPVVTLYQVGKEAVNGNLKPAVSLLAPGVSKVDQAVAFANGDTETKAQIITENVLEVGTALLGGKASGSKVKGKPDYSSILDSKSVGPGKKFTATQKKKILDANRQANGGKLRSDKSGKKLDNPVQSKKGEKANMNQAEVDHIRPKSKNGSNSNKNAQVLSKEENLKKSNN